MAVSVLRSVLPGLTIFAATLCGTWGVCECWRCAHSVVPRDVGVQARRQCARTTCAVRLGDALIGISARGDRFVAADCARAMSVRIPCRVVPRAITTCLRLALPKAEGVLVTGAIYRCDGSLMCQAEPVRVHGAVDGWVTLPVIPAGALAAGQECLVVVHCSDPQAWVAARPGDGGRTCGEATLTRAPWPARLDAEPDGHAYSINLVVELAAGPPRAAH